MDDTIAWEQQGIRKGRLHHRAVLRITSTYIIFTWLG